MNLFDRKPHFLRPCSGQTTIWRASGKNLFCDNCGTAIRRHISQCRGKTKCCSPACAAEIRRIRIEKQCIICGTVMRVIPSDNRVACADCLNARKAYDCVKRYGACRYGGLTRSKYRRRKLGRHVRPTKRKVLIVDTGRVFQSITDASFELGVTVQAVHNAIKKNRRTRGFLVVYA